MQDSIEAISEVIAIFEDGEKIKVKIQYNQPTLFDYIQEPNSELEMNSKQIASNQAIDFKLGKLEIKGEKGSLKNKTTLKGITLRSVDMPVMGSGMVNVTGDYKGYRLYPTEQYSIKP